MTKTRWIFQHIRVEAVEQKQLLVKSWKDKSGETQSEYKKVGWYVHFHGSWESLYFGEEEPALKVDDLVRITIEKE